MPSDPPVSDADPQPWRVRCRDCGLDETVFDHADAQRVQTRHRFAGCSLAEVRPE